MAVGSVTRVVETARRELNDVGPVYKWRDIELCAYLVQGQIELIKVRPDAAISDSIQITAPATTLAKGDSLTVDTMFEPVLTYYVCYQALSKSAQYADANKAQAFYQRFTESLGR